MSDAAAETAEEGSTDEAERSGLSDSEIFDILRNSRRRTVITHLIRTGEPVGLKELTKQVAAEEYDVKVEDVSSDQHKRVYTGLYQCHIPRLDEFDVVDFDRDGKRVGLGENAGQVAPYLDGGGGSERVRAELVVAVAVAALVTTGVLGGGPVGRLPVTALAAVTVVALLGTALYQLYK